MPSPLCQVLSAMRERGYQLGSSENTLLLRVSHNCSSSSGIMSACLCWCHVCVACCTINLCVDRENILLEWTISVLGDVCV